MKRICIEDIGFHRDPLRASNSSAKGWGKVSRGRDNSAKAEAKADISGGDWLREQRLAKSIMSSWSEGECG